MRLLLNWNETVMMKNGDNIFGEFTFVHSDFVCGECAAWGLIYPGFRVFLCGRDLKRNSRL